MDGNLLGIEVLSSQGKIIAPAAEVAARLPVSEATQTALDGKATLGGVVGPDEDWVIPAGAVHIVVPALTASRTWSLTDVDAYPRGQDRVIVDESRSLGSGPILTIVPLAGTGDAIAGFPGGLLLQDAGASVRLRRGLLSDVWVIV